MKQFFKKHKRMKGDGEAPTPSILEVSVFGAGWGGEQPPHNNSLIPIFSQALSMYSDDFKHKE